MKRTYKQLTRIAGQVSQARSDLIPLHQADQVVDPRVIRLVKPDEYWVEVDRSQQVLYLYFYMEIVGAWLVSTGRPGGPRRKSRATRPGVYRVYGLYERYPMWGIEDAATGWWCPDVPWVIWFHGELAIHGAYWHNDFGMPVSHGCVNMAEMDAKDLYGYMVKGREGTVIWIH